MLVDVRREDRMGTGTTLNDMLASCAFKTAVGHGVVTDETLNVISAEPSSSSQSF